MGQTPLYEACAFGEALIKMGYPLIASLRGRLITGALTRSPIHDHPAPSGLAPHGGVLIAPASMERGDRLLEYERAGHRRAAQDARVIWA